jgi:sugar phosphate isomerase/epimerase
VGANLDTGNAFWTLEDPMDVIETLGPVALCSSLRDAMVWEAPEGATMQWTAAGEGLLDWRAIADRWRALCPRTPVIIETISGNPRTFAYRQPGFWDHYDRRPEKLARFEALAKRGKPIPAFKAPAGPEGRVATQNFQRAELERSLAHLRTAVGLGRRA